MNMHDIYRPFLKFFRKKRMDKFQKNFKVNDETKILDLGGGWFNWSFIHQQPKVIFVNIIKPKENEKKLNWIIADGCYLPFKNQAFDIVYSNSVIEHLANYENQQLFASECIRVGKRFYVQTPNKWFPVEPHLIALFIHWFPKGLQLRLIPYLSVWGWIAHPSKNRCEILLSEVRLLTEKEMIQLFPEGSLWREKFLGLTKSLIAIKNR